MAAPSLLVVKTYLGTDHSWSDEEIGAALAAEIAAQANVVVFPVDPATNPYPNDLVEALCRRVAANLAVRALPLGVSASMSEAYVATTQVGGRDREVERLEGPYRPIVIA